MPLGSARPWFYPPDGGVLERLEWATDVINSFDASEQRVKLLDLPRRSFEFGNLFSARERRVAENTLHVGQAGEWAVPVWVDSQALAANLASGSSVIAVDTTTRDFAAGGMAVLCTDASTFEVVDIDSKTDASITLTTPTATSWSANVTRVIPLRIARMPDEVRLSRFTGDTSYGRMQFECVKGSAGTAATETGLYRTFPVLGTAPNWTDDVDQGFLRKLASLSTGTGPAFFDEEGSGSVPTQTHRWLLDGRAQIDAFRQWLYARAGRLTSFWLPTFTLDLLVVADIGSAATTIDIEHQNYTSLSARGIGRRDIRIELVSGAVYYRRITGSTVISASIERVSIDSALGVAVTAAQIRSVSFMNLVRLDTDAVEIAWLRHDLAEVALVTRGSRNDL